MRRRWRWIRRSRTATPSPQTWRTSPASPRRRTTRTRRGPWWAALFWAVWLAAPGQATAVTEPIVAVTVVAEGLVPFQSDLSLNEVRVRARDEARRNAIEQAVGVFVRGKSVVHNSQIVDELILSVDDLGIV